MKKIMLALLGLIFFVSGCKTIETTTVVPSAQLTSPKVGPQLQALTQKYIADLSKKDSAVFFQEVYFYNRSSIDLSLFIYDRNKPFNVVNGVAEKENTNVDLLKTVPEMTPGKIVDVKFDEKNPQIITGLLLVFDANDRSYRLKFHRRISPNDGTFILIKSATIDYKNQQYKVEAKTPAGSSQDCLLMFYGDQKANTLKVMESAKGFKSGPPPTEQNGLDPKKETEDW